MWRPNAWAASGRNGVSSGLKSAKMLRKYFVNIRGSSPGTANAFKSPNSRSISANGVGSVDQTPDKSGLPFAPRGVGAERLGLPSFVRGMPAAGWFSHCAWTDAARAQNITVTIVRRSISPLSRHGTRAARSSITPFRADQVRHVALRVPHELYRELAEARQEHRLGAGDEEAIERARAVLDLQLLRRPLSRRPAVPTRTDTCPRTSRAPPASA